MLMTSLRCWWQIWSFRSRRAQINKTYCMSLKSRCHQQHCDYKVVIRSWTFKMLVTATSVKNGYIWSYYGGQNSAAPSILVTFSEGKCPTSVKKTPFKGDIANMILVTRCQLKIVTNIVSHQHPSSTMMSPSTMMSSTVNLLLKPFLGAYDVT